MFNKCGSQVRGLLTVAHGLTIASRAVLAYYFHNDGASLVHPALREFEGLVDFRGDFVHINIFDDHLLIHS